MVVPTHLQTAILTIYWIDIQFIVAKKKMFKYELILIIKHILCKTLLLHAFPPF